MNTAKILILFGAILTLLSTFLFALTYISDISGDFYLSGIGFIQNTPDVFKNPSNYESDMDVPFYFVLILYFIFFIFMLSGLFQLVGLKNRGLSIFGSILPILFSIFLMLLAFEVLDIDFYKYMIMFKEEAFVEDILPFHFNVGDAPVGELSGELSLGTYLLLGGGILALVGGILGPED